ncbi:MAG TPA: lysylphosphatidylglycerol synthase domain-containing protein [Williamwhitmania sp.]|nr:lysylphosphatidylglycerol synthase domain-containing protein [Williamwhitmania sp.]
MIIVLGVTVWLFILWEGVPMAESLMHGRPHLGENMHPLSLLGALLLMPVNWGLESAKWFMLVKSDLSDGFRQAFRSVLGGLALGLITPNRIGEPFTRSMLLKSESYVSTTAAALLCSLAQQVTTIVFGTAGMLILIHKHRMPLLMHSVHTTFLMAAGLSAGLIILMLLFPALLKKLAKLAFMKRLKQSFRSLSLFGLIATIKVTALSVARYAIFTSQYLLLIYGFGANAPIEISFAAIASIYLIGSAIPSVALADMGVRVSLALIFLGPIVGNGVAIMASSTLWLVNIGFPASIGSILLLIKPERNIGSKNGSGPFL